MAIIHNRFKKRVFEFNLTATGIDQSTEWLIENLKDTNAEKSDRLRMRLMFENALLNMAKHFDDEPESAVYLEKRQGRYRLRLLVRGDRFNPLKHDEEDELDEWSRPFFSFAGLHAQYSYAAGANVLRISMPRHSWNPVLKIAVAIIAGFIAGVLGNVLIPQDTQIIVTDVVLSPVSDMWVRLLQAISGPIIFLTALTATFGSKRIADFGGSRIATVIRYFVISAFVTVFALICSHWAFPLDISITEARGDTLSDMLDGILQFVPSNLVDPFETANTPQLLLIAIVTGYFLATLESSLGELNALVQQLNILGLTVAERACALVPFFVGILLCLKIWTHDTDMLAMLLMPLALSAAISCLAFLAVVFSASMRFHVSPILLIRKLKDPFFAALKRGSLDFSSVDDLAASCKNLLGIDREFARAALPQGLFLYMPTGAIGLCVFLVFAAWEQQLVIDQAWAVSAAALSVVLSVATPPMSGANLLSFVMAFSYLGITDSAILAVMVFDIVFGVLNIALDQAMLQVATISMADHLGFLDEKTLRAPIADAA